MMVIHCVGHSGFSVETETHMLIFDYWKGVLPRLPMKKKLYVFVSHSHDDHFNPDVLSLCRDHPNVRFVLSNDTPLADARARGVRECIVAEPGMDMHTESRFRIKALPSTDRGVAYLVCMNGRNLFHAGEAHPENARRTLDEAFARFGPAIVAAHGKDILEGDGISFCGTGRGIVDFPYMAEKLKEAGFAGDMFLHGIYDPDDMPRALAYWLEASGARS